MKFINLFTFLYHPENTLAGVTNNYKNGSRMGCYFTFGNLAQINTRNLTSRKIALFAISYQIWNNCFYFQFQVFFQSRYQSVRAAKGIVMIFLKDCLNLTKFEQGEPIFIISKINNSLQIIFLAEIFAATLYYVVMVSSNTGI